MAAKQISEKITALTSIVIPTDEKKLGVFIDNAVVAYGNGKVRVHCAAVAGLMHSAEHGNADMLNRIYRGLHSFDVNEASKFRVWVGENATYQADTESGVQTKQWAGFSKEKFEKEGKAFFVKTGLADERAATLEKRSAILNGRRFYQKADKDADAMTLEKILEALSRIEKATEKKAEKGDGISIPADIMAQVRELAKAATVAKANLH